MAKKKLLSEAQVRKFMGLAKLDANMSSAFLSENWGEKEDEYKRHDVGGTEKKAGDEDGHYKDYMKEDEEMDAEEVSMDAEVEMPVADLEGGEPEVTDEAPDVDMDTETLKRIADALGTLQADLSPLMSAAGISGDEEMDAEMPPMDAEMPPMDDEMPPMEMDAEEEMMETSSPHSQISEEEIVQEVTRRVAKRINQAARAQKKANKLLGRSKK
tara:strand:+ start:21 stop:662 length:642 start_codon:yes stop_codon:yes gene_type:complete